MLWFQCNVACKYGDQNSTILKKALTVFAMGREKAQEATQELWRLIVFFIFAHYQLQ